jgi:predicted LPLAT superfamily acyltransferase
LKYTLKIEGTGEKYHIGIPLVNAHLPFSTFDRNLLWSLFEEPEEMESQTSSPKRRTETPLGSSIGMKLLAFVMRILPTRLAYLIAYIPVLWYYMLRPEGRLSASRLHERLGLAGGGFSCFRFGFRQARDFSRIILDNIYLGIFGPKRFEIAEYGTDIFKKTLEKGRGLLLLSAHVGNWHLAVNFLKNTQTRVHLVTDDARQAEVRHQMDRAKMASDHLTVHNLQKDTGLVFTLSAALKRGEVVIIAGDRAPSGGRRVKVPFLGKDAWFPTSGLAVAAAVNAPVCTALTFRTGTRRYECHGLGPFESGRDYTDKNAKIEAMAREFASHLEVYVRRFPTQWFNFYDFWKAD